MLFLLQIQNPYTNGHLIILAKARTEMEQVEARSSRAGMLVNNTASPSAFYFAGFLNADNIPVVENSQNLNSSKLSARLAGHLPRHYVPAELALPDLTTWPDHGHTVQSQSSTTQELFKLIYLFRPFDSVSGMNNDTESKRKSQLANKCRRWLIHVHCVLVSESAVRCKSQTTKHPSATPWSKAP